MQLRLVEYNLETGKFKHFIDIGEKRYSLDEILERESSDLLISGFAYLGDEIQVYYIDCGAVHYNMAKGGAQEKIQKTFKLDKKDPLNRFNGLFDGRTYGEGRFVLIKKRIDDFGNIYFGGTYWEDCVVIDKVITKNIDQRNSRFYDPNLERPIIESREIMEVIGNLHENPELWEKIN